MIKEGSIIKKNSKKHSKNSIRQRKESRKKGRHSGIGKRKGTKNARTPIKKLWIIRQRVLRNFLKKSKSNSKIDKHLYRELYLKCKGNEFKNKRTLIEYIHKAKTENTRKSLLFKKFEKKKEKKFSNREKKIQKFNQKMIQIGAKI